MTIWRKIRVWAEIGGIRQEAVVECALGYEGIKALNFTLNVIPHGWNELEIDDESSDPEQGPGE